MFEEFSSAFTMVLVRFTAAFSCFFPLLHHSSAAHNRSARCCQCTMFRWTFELLNKILTLALKISLIMKSTSPTLDKKLRNLPRKHQTAKWSWKVENSERNCPLSRSFEDSSRSHQTSITTDENTQLTGDKLEALLTSPLRPSIFTFAGQKSVNSRQFLAFLKFNFICFSSTTRYFFFHLARLAFLTLSFATTLITRRCQRALQRFNAKCRRRQTNCSQPSVFATCMAASGRTNDWR